MLTLNAGLLCESVDHENLTFAVRLDVKLVGCDVSAEKTKKLKFYRFSNFTPAEASSVETRARDTHKFISSWTSITLL